MFGFDLFGREFMAGKAGCIVFTYHLWLLRMVLQSGGKAPHTYVL
jgi:hypothetical protein